MSFNGASNIITINETNFNSDFQNGFTISVWVYVRSIPNASRVFDKTVTTSSTGGLFMYLASNKFIAQVNGAGTLTSDPFSLNTWTHVVMTVDSVSHVKLYVNGTKSGATVTGGALSGLTINGLALGNRLGATDRRLDGYIDNFRVYSSDITGAEAQKLYTEEAVEHGIALLY